MESLNLLRRPHGQGCDGGQPFPQRRRIVSEPTDAFFLISSDFIDGIQPPVIDNLTPSTTLSSTQHNFLLSSGGTIDRTSINTSHESQFVSELLGEPFDNGSCSPPSSAAVQFSTTIASSTQGCSNPAKSGHVCTECDRLFSRPERLRQHISFKRCAAGSVSESSHDCGQCGKSFTSKVQLSRHLKVHIGDNRTTEYECEKADCGRSYNTYSSYMKHRRSHDNGGEGVSPPPLVSSSASGSSAGSTPSKRPHKEPSEKRFQCLQCSKRFPTSKDLKRHDVVHTGNREFQCSFCTHRFGRKDHRMRHEKKTHALELQQQQQKTTAPPPALPKQASSPAAQPPPLVATDTILTAVDVVRRQRLRHVSSPSTFRDPPTSASSPPRALFQNMLVSSPPPLVVKEEFKQEETSEFESLLMETKSENSPMDIFGMTEDNSDKKISDIPEQTKDLLPSVAPLAASLSPPETTGIMLVHDSNLGLVRIVEPPRLSDSSQQQRVNGDLDSLLSEIISDAPMVDDDAAESIRREMSVPVSALAASFQTASATTASFSTSYGGASSSAAAAASVPANSQAKLMSDMFTRTKNPVLPSIYIDNSLIVPEPSKQKYHSTHHTHSLLFEGDFMEVDNFLRSANSTTGDGKEITESIFNM